MFVFGSSVLLHIFFILTAAGLAQVEETALRWLNTVLAVSGYMSFANLWQEKGCSSQAETWQVENILRKDFDSQVKFDIFVVSMAT